MKLIMISAISFIAGGASVLLASNVLPNNDSKVKEMLYYQPPSQVIPELPPLPPEEKGPGVIPLEVVPYQQLPQEPKATPAPVKSKSVIRIVKTNDTVFSTKDPIWKVELVVNNKVVESVNALIGRSYRQTANRHTSGNKSPLPLGTYSVDTSGIERGPFGDPEVGAGFWIPIQPTFSTNRSYLGIHHDPSWGKNNGESGTSGCVGLKTVDDTKKVVNWVRQYNVRSLVVES